VDYRIIPQARRPWRHCPSRTRALSPHKRSTADSSTTAAHLKQKAASSGKPVRRRRCRAVAGPADGGPNTPGPIQPHGSVADGGHAVGPECSGHASPGPARDVIDWYLNGIPKHTDQVGVAEAEKVAEQRIGS
jgi:hypothetical protein